MPKLHKWLAICIRSPYENLGHFIKWFAIFSRPKNINRKRKERLNRIKKGLTWPRAQLAVPGPAAAQPSLDGGHMRLLPPPSRQAGRRQAPWARQAAACLPRGYPLVWRRLGDAQLHSPPSRATSPSSLAMFVVDRRDRRSTMTRSLVNTDERPNQAVPRVQRRALRRSAED